VQAAGLDCLDIAWIDHELVEEAIRRSDAVAFTGSTHTGRIIASLAGKHLKKTVLELGGSNPFIVLADADVEAAADAVNSRFRDAGQSCNAAKRMIVVPEIAEQFVAAFVAAASALRPGDPRHPATTLSPSPAATCAKPACAGDGCLSSGCQPVAGRTAATSAGLFLPGHGAGPCHASCRVYHEEVFGPVASILRARDEADAIRLANDTPFGLGASIYTANTTHGWELARQLEVGSVFINRHTSSDLRLPFGGVKASGYGRELSEFGLYEFVNVKTYWQK
jgi:succinate-semialdehyde dehydrogenase/glutarate-semialdehyde dehydrogenase/succinate-semialdehyde dehydrogenase